MRWITLPASYSCSNNGLFDFLLECVFREMPIICTSGNEATFVLTVIRRLLQGMHCRLYYDIIVHNKQLTNDGMIHLINKIFSSTTILICGLLYVHY